MLTMFIRAIILYVVVAIAMRLMGKRQIGQLQPYEFAMAVMIADLAAAPLSDVSIPLAYGLLPIAALALIEAIISILTFKSEKIRAVVTGLPSVVIREGQIDEKELKRLCLNLNDLLEQVRLGGIADVSEVGTAVLETSGNMSVFPISQKRPLSPMDMSIPTQHESIPITLVLDGRVQTRNIETYGYSESWLKSTLKHMGVSDYKRLLICSINSLNVVYAQEKVSGALHYLQLDKGGKAV